jgi:hypothetical protein
MTQTVAINQQNVSLRIKMLDSSGAPATGITASDAGHVIWYQRGASGSVVTDGGSAADLASLGAAHSDWGFEEIGYGWYRVDYPDAAFLEGALSVICGMSTDAADAVEVLIDIDPFFKYQGVPSSVTSTTTTFPAGTTPLKGDLIMVVDGTGEPGNIVVVQSASGEVATHAAFETAISDTTTTVLLIAGDATLADGGINVDAAVTTRSSLTPAEVLSECQDAIDSRNLATASALATVDTEVGVIDGIVDDIKAKTDSLTFTKSGEVDANMQSINDATVVGDGNATPWDGA